jgi:hypothetical protein
MIISRSFLLRVGSVSERSCTGNQITHFIFNTFFFKNHGVYEIMWKNIVQPDRPQISMQYGACAVHAGEEATDTHSEYVTRIAFQR